MKNKVKKKDLGEGVKALFGNFNIDRKIAEQPEEAVKETANMILMLPVEQIEVNPYQPRNDFESEALNELADSIKIHGLIQPVTVRRLNDTSYQLISGERRWRASQIAGLEEIPAYVRVVDGDQEMLEMAIIENVQREQLNPIEVGTSYQRLIDECELTHEDVADRVGKSRVSVTNYLRVIKLPPNMQKALKEGDISMGHGKVLAGVDNIILLNQFFKRTIDLNLSVRALENMVRNAKKPKVPSSAKSSLPADYQKVQNQLRNFLEAKVELKLKDVKKGNGTIVIHFDSNDTLNDLIDRIED